MQRTIIIGGGLAGLSAAAVMARAGRPVTVLERSRTLGGRGQTEVEHGYAWNLGPHALYAGGPAERLLTRLGVAFRAPKAEPDRSFFWERGALVPLPAGPLSLLAHPGLGTGEKWSFGKALSQLVLARPGLHAEQTVEAWLADHVRPSLHPWFRTLFRVSTYTEWPERQSAEIALAQLQHVSRHGVRYVDGGWQRLSEGLAAVARAAGAEIRTEARVERVHADRAVREVVLADGQVLPAQAVILAVDPSTAAQLLLGAAGTQARRWANDSIPVQAATLDVALSTWPNPKVKVAFGVEQASYFSVHSATAQLAPAGGALMHVARYLRPDAPVTVTRAELEAELDLLQPGWREALVGARFLPKLTVMHRAVLADQGGLAGRPSFDGLCVAGLCVAGDWVGERGLLLDAALSSAGAAAEHLLGLGSGTIAA